MDKLKAFAKDTVGYQEVQNVNLGYKNFAYQPPHLCDDLHSFWDISEKAWIGIR